MPSLLIPSIPTDQLAQLALILGFVTPPIVAFINQSHWPKFWKAWVTAGVSTGQSLLVLGFQNRLDWHNLSATSIAVLTMATLIYRMFWKSAGADLIEAKTNLKG